MESTDSSTGGSQQQQQQQEKQPHQLPPGFRFHPTDEELVIHYLKRKANSSPLPVRIIAEVDLYKFDPWELPGKATFGEQEWYFFSPRDRKYPNGARPNRAATSGYWKATGTDKPILTSGGTQKVGVKKALVFYGGKPPKGIKTNWIMHEYRLTDSPTTTTMRPPGTTNNIISTTKKSSTSLRLDEWVLCRIYKKNNNSNQRLLPMDQNNKEDSSSLVLDDDNMLSSVLRPTSSTINGGSHQQMVLMTNNNPKSHTTTSSSKATITSYSGLIENDDHNFLEDLLSDHHHQFGCSSSSNSKHAVAADNSIGAVMVPEAATINSNNTTNSLSLKPNLSYYNQEAAGNLTIPSSAKNKLIFQPHQTTNIRGGGNYTDGSISNSISNLLNQSTQFQQQQTILGSLDDGVFRDQSYQLSRMNWNS